MTARTAIEIGLTAAIVAVDGDEPTALEPRTLEPMTLTAGGGAALFGLPSGPFDPLEHRTFEIGLRSWVKAQTGLAVGYVVALALGQALQHQHAGEVELASREIASA